MIVIGSGPAGRRAAIQAAKLGKKVLVVEKGRKVGGVSVHTGTIPSKTLRETALNLSGWRERSFYGRAYRVKHDIKAKDLQTRLQLTLSHEVDVLEHQFSRNGVATLTGTAKFLSATKIQVEDSNGNTSAYTADKFLIAVGTMPYRPSKVPFDGKNILDSDEILEISTLPGSIAVVGAGVIGVEYATIFSALDVQVTLIDSREHMLDFVDADLMADFQHQLRNRGVMMRLGSKIDKIHYKEKSTCHISFNDGRMIDSEVVLYAVGRVGATKELALDACGLDVDDRGRLTVDPATFQTRIPHIYAAGDIIGFPSLASTSMEQGRIAACHAFDKPTHSPKESFPFGIYSVPEISTVGLTERQVRDQNIRFECGIARFGETSRGHILGLNSGLLKLIFCLDTRRLLGCHIVGEGATELIHIGQAVINLGGKLEYFVENTFNYPTLAEAYKIAALDAWNRMPSSNLAERSIVASNSRNRTHTSTPKRLH